MVPRCWNEHLISVCPKTVLSMRVRALSNESKRCLSIAREVETLPADPSGPVDNANANNGQEARNATDPSGPVDNTNPSNGQEARNETPQGGDESEATGPTPFAHCGTRRSAM